VVSFLNDDQDDDDGHGDQIAQAWKRRNIKTKRSMQRYI